MSAKKPPRTPTSTTKTVPRRSTRSSSNRSLAQVSDDESRASSRGGNSVGSSSTVSRDKTPLWFDKLFAFVLESPEWGCGIENVGEGKKHKLEKLLDNFQKDRKEEPLKPFGDRGDPIRRTLTQKHQKWKALPEVKYLRKLGRLSIDRHSVSAWKSRNKVDADEEDYEGSQSLSSKSASEKKPPTPKSSNKTRTPRNPQEVPSYVTTTSPTEALCSRLQDTRISEPKATSHMMSELCPGAREKANELGADIKEICDPLGKIRHGEVFTYPILSHKFSEGGARWYCESGISVEMPGDFCDHSDSKWSAQHVPGFENAILIRQPKLPKSATSKGARQQHENTLGQGAKDGRDLAMTAFRDVEEVKEYKLLVVFPPHMHLSNKPFHSNKFTGDDELDPDLDIDYDVTHIRQKTSWAETVENKDRDVYTYQSWIRWQFVDLKTKKPLSKPSNKKKKGLANAKMGDLSKFDSMTLGDSDDDGE